MRILKITATLLATSLMVGMVALPKTSYSVERALRQQHQQHAGVVQGHQQAHARTIQLKDAFVDPRAALANGTALDQALRAASADGGSAAAGLIPGMPGGTIAEKIDAYLHVEGGGAADNVHKAAIRTALGLNSDAASLLAGSPESTATRRFGEVAHEELVVVPAVGTALAGMGGVTAQAKLANVLARLNAGTHNAMGGAPVAAPAAADIHNALTRLGL